MTRRWPKHSRRSTSCATAGSWSTIEEEAGRRMKLHSLIGFLFLAGCAVCAAQDRRGSSFASWSPEKMAERRTTYGLIGPGPQSRFPEARFPAYLKKPKTVEEILPAARAAVTPTRGRVPLSLASPGDE